MEKVGILTYHSAYNYGSVLQAYATQRAVEALCGNAQIINFRMAEQKNFYALYRYRYGARTLVKDLMQLPVHGKRKARCAAFEDFLSRYMNLSPECETPEQVYQLWDRYDTIVSGSDQIWNKHSQELEHNGWEYMMPYLLRGFAGKKVSYASSIANMTDEELGTIVPYVADFQAVSLRESSSAQRMAKVLGKVVDHVVDPTFLLTKEQWIQALGLKKKENREDYILYYSLGGLEPLRANRAILAQLAQKHHCKVKIVTPFAYLPPNDPSIEMHPEFGPVEFLEAIYNAKMIVSNSYHGTILSVNFGKDVYSLCEKTGSEFRKTDILERIGMEGRIIFRPEDLCTTTYPPIDYNCVEQKLAALRTRSQEYLKQALDA